MADVIGTSALKPSDGFTKPVPMAIVVLGYGAAFYFLSLTLRTIPIGIAYAVRFDDVRDESAHPSIATE